MTERVLLIGMMASGKTTVGRLVAEALGAAFLDSDAQVEARTGRTVREIFEAEGEPAFRREEKRALEAALATPGPIVVAVAGGAVLDPDNREALAAGGTVVWLRASADVLAARVSAGRDHRPLLGDDPVSSLRRLASEREALYAGLADIVVDVDGLSASGVAARILESVPA